MSYNDAKTFWKSCQFLLKIYLRNEIPEGIRQWRSIINKCAQCERNTANYNWNDTPVITNTESETKRAELHLTIILHGSVTIREASLKN